MAKIIDVVGTVQDMVGLTETAADRIERLALLVGDAKGEEIDRLVNEARGYLQRTSVVLDRFENGKR